VPRFSSLPAYRPRAALAPRLHPAHACPHCPAILCHVRSDPAPARLSQKPRSCDRKERPIFARSCPQAAHAPPLCQAPTPPVRHACALPACNQRVQAPRCLCDLTGKRVTNRCVAPVLCTTTFHACSPPQIRAFLPPVLAPTTLPAHATLVLPAACSFRPQLQGP